MQPLCFYPVMSLPEVTPGSCVPTLIHQGLAHSGLALCPGDVIVVTHKILSKAQGLVVNLDSVTQVSLAAQKAAQLCHKDPRLTELAARASHKLYACARDILLAVRKDGWICCNAGIDHSNAGEKNTLVLLGQDCDAQAKSISDALSTQAGFAVPVIICDTQGRVLRNGTVGVVVGSFGLQPIRSYRGCTDRDGTPLVCTQEAVADELAGAATLVMGQGSEGIPAVLVRGCTLAFSPHDSTALKRPESDQLYTPTGIEIFPTEEQTL